MYRTPILVRSGRGRRSVPPRLAGIAVIATAFLAACSDDPTDPNDGPRVADVSFEPDSILLFEGEARDLSDMVVLRAADGEVLEDREIQWESSAPAVVTVDGGGGATGEASGSATVIATSEGVAGELAVTVEVAPDLDIASVEPDSLEEGGTATLRGSGFEVGDLRITIGGIRATILEAEADRAEVEVPYFCLPEGQVEVVASILDDRVTDAVVHPNRGSGSLEMEAGEFRYVEDPEDFCLLFQEASADEEYAFGVQSTSGAGTLTPVRVTASSGHGDPAVAARDALEAGPLGTATAPARTRGDGAPATGSHDLTDFHADIGAVERWRRHYAVEASIRQRDREFVEGLRRRWEGPTLAADSHIAAQSPVAASIPGDVAEGDTVEVRVPDLDSDNFCQEYASVTTVAEVVGSEAVWLVDVENPADAGFARVHYQDVSDAFDADVYPAVEEHFGEPAEVGDLDRIAVVVSQAVNDFDESPLGFVVSTDFVPRPEDAGSGEPACPSSDHANMFYTRAPGGDQSFTADIARREFPRLAAHELTHVIQFGRRITADHPFPSVWELEGQAVLGEEVAGHRTQGNEARENLSVAETALPNGAEEDEPLWYYFSFFDLFSYFGLAVDENDNLDRVEDAPEECSWLERSIDDAPCEMGSREPYGVAWTFLRWLADQFHDELPDGEATLHQEMIDSDAVGFSNVEGVLGESWRPLLAQWAATLYVDGRFENGGDPRIDFPSWDLSAMDDELVEEVQLQPRERSFEAFEDELQVRGGSSSYFVISGADRPAIGVRAGTLEGDLLPSPMQMWVVRIR